MFQRGEVDYLVATDAIGMGLNMDVDPCRLRRLFRKFDGRRDRRLTIRRNGADRRPRRAPPARRQLRHAGLERRALAAFSPRRSSDRGASLPPARLHLYWRAPSSISATSRADPQPRAKSDDPLLRPAPEAIDLAVLKLIAEDPAIAAKRGVQARRLWAVCGLPDFRKVGPMHHARMVRRLFSYIGEGGQSRTNGSPPRSRGSTMSSGDIEALADRLAGSAAGPISPTAPTGCRPGQMGRAHARGRGGSATRCTSG
jgi:ATP-dependent RNA helicase SUPV3L1/SUV3